MTLNKTESTETESFGLFRKLGDKTDSLKPGVLLGVELTANIEVLFIRQLSECVKTYIAYKISCLVIGSVIMFIFSKQLPINNANSSSL